MLQVQIKYEISLKGSSQLRVKLKWWCFPRDGRECCDVVLLFSVSCMCVQELKGTITHNNLFLRGSIILA